MGPFTLAFDASPLVTFARAGRLAVLEEITRGACRVVLTDVLGEVRRGLDKKPDLASVLDATWLEAVELSSPAEIGAFGHYASRLVGKGALQAWEEKDPSLRNVGEATTLAWVEVNGGVAIIDELAGRTVGRNRRLDVTGSLGLIQNAWRGGHLDDVQVQGLVDRLIKPGGAWFPCTGEEFLAGLRAKGELPPTWPFWDAASSS